MIFVAIQIQVICILHYVFVFGFWCYCCIGLVSSIWRRVATCESWGCEHMLPFRFCSIESCRNRYIMLCHQLWFMAIENPSQKYPELQWSLSLHVQADLSFDGFPTYTCTPCTLSNVVSDPCVTSMCTRRPVVQLRVRFRARWQDLALFGYPTDPQSPIIRCWFFDWCLKQFMALLELPILLLAVRHVGMIKLSAPLIL